MSKIIDEITCLSTGQRFLERKPFAPLVTVEQTVSPVSFDYLEECFVGVKLGLKLRLKAEDKEYALRFIRRHLIDLIFGEFHEDLNLLEYQLYERNFDDAIQTTREIRKKMFYE